MKITRYSIDFPEPLAKQGQFIGIDPGTVNMGIAEIGNIGVSYCHIYQIHMTRVKLIDRISQLSSVMGACLNTFHHRAMYSIIEGASYGGYRQVELAEVRAICAMWLMTKAVSKIATQPPLSIRKKVFGSAKIHAESIWLVDDPIPDALAALSCAYLASFFDW